MMSMAAARFDVARFGSEVFRPSPRQADLMIIAAACRKKWRRDQTTPRADARTKWVISMGACATSGGVFNNYAIVQASISDSGDIYVPDARPGRSLLYAILQLQEK